jgi:hypothetical protein
MKGWKKRLGIFNYEKPVYKQAPPEPQQKQHPASMKIAAGLTALVAKYGVTDTELNKACSSGIAQAYARCVSKMQKRLQGGTSYDDLLLKFSEEAKVLMAVAGISDVEQQEALILDYFALVEASL